MTTLYEADGLQWTDDPLWMQFEGQARAAPDAPALITPDGRSWSRSELAHQATAAAEALQAHGVQAGDLSLIHI